MRKVLKYIGFTTLLLPILMCSRNTPEALFTIEESGPYLAPATLTFQNSSSPATDYLWDFGDGGKSEVFEPNHTYVKDGVYTVTLKAENYLHGNDTYTKSVEVINTPLQAPNAYFESPVVTDVGFEMEFNNQTSGTLPITYLWNFGDNGTSDLENPTHTFANGGKFSVLLTASNSVGTDTFSRQITVYNEPRITFIEVYSFSADLNSFDVGDFPDVFAEIYYQEEENGPWILESRTLQVEINSFPDTLYASSMGCILTNLDKRHRISFFDLDEGGIYEEMDYSLFSPDDQEFQVPTYSVKVDNILRFIIHMIW